MTALITKADDIDLRDATGAYYAALFDREYLSNNRLYHPDDYRLSDDEKEKLYTKMREQLTETRVRGHSLQKAVDRAVMLLGQAGPKRYLPVKATLQYGSHPNSAVNTAAREMLEYIDEQQLA